MITLCLTLKSIVLGLLVWKEKKAIKAHGAPQVLFLELFQLVVWALLHFWFSAVLWELGEDLNGSA